MVVIHLPLLFRLWEAQIHIQRDDLRPFAVLKRVSRLILGSRVVRAVLNRHPYRHALSLLHFLLFSALPLLQCFCPVSFLPLVFVLVQFDEIEPLFGHPRLLVLLPVALYNHGRLDHILPFHPLLRYSRRRPLRKIGVKIDVDHPKGRSLKKPPHERASAASGVGSIPRCSLVHDGVTILIKLDWHPVLVQRVVQVVLLVVASQKACRDPSKLGI
mmetsp:Transcript_35495/g.82196  ORF Transcript_35495/g.82196 Transcript_35495/m.82196 type:complete len:215 (-) Transcript_35495:725-1369(-)